jgi:hypothetical protein
MDILAWCTSLVVLWRHADGVTPPADAWQRWVLQWTLEAIVSNADSAAAELPASASHFRRHARRARERAREQDLTLTEAGPRASTVEEAPWFRSLHGNPETH